MKRITALVVSLLLFAHLFAQSSKVLFIGNSYTYVNNLPELIANMYLSDGDTLFYTMSAPGGCTFQQHCSVSLPYIQQGGWDYVVLQEQSQLPSFPYGQFMQESYPYAQQLCDSIHQYSPDSHTVFYMTWGRKNGDSQNAVYYAPLATYEGMDSLLYARYMLMATDNHACVSPVGAAWHFIRDNYVDMELYQSDESHPSYLGSYIAACCFYTMFTHRNPMDIAWNGSLTENQAQIAKNAVKTVVYDSLSKWCFEDEPLPIDSTAIPFHANSTLSVYPNPASQTLYVSSDDATTLTTLVISDLYGKELLHQRHIHSETIDVSFLKDGIYLLSLTDGVRKKTTKLIIVH